MANSTNRKTPLMSAMLNWGFVWDGLSHVRGLFGIFHQSSFLLISFTRISWCLNSSAHGQPFRNINPMWLSPKSLPINDSEQLGSWFIAAVRVLEMSRNPSTIPDLTASTPSSGDDSKFPLILFSKSCFKTWSWKKKKKDSVALPFTKANLSLFFNILR